MASQNLPTSQLEAINSLLATIGDPPVSTLNGAVTDSVAIASNTFNEVNRDVQQHGWNFNTEVNFPLTPDTSGIVRTPNNTLRVIFKQQNQLDLVVRGNVVYDRSNRTSDFSSLASDGLTALKLVLFLDFTQLPETARRYITVRAARLFQQRVQGSPLVEQFTAVEEAAALRELQSYESSSQKLNVLHTPRTAWFLRRWA